MPVGKARAAPVETASDEFRLIVPCFTTIERPVITDHLQRDHFFWVDLTAPTDLPGFALDERDYFRDVYDHLVRISDLIDSYRDLLSGATDLYLSTVSGLSGSSASAACWPPAPACSSSFTARDGYEID